MPSRPTSRTSILKISASSRRSALWLALIGAAAGSALRGQAVTIRGTVVGGGAPSRPVAGRYAVLHQIGMQSQGPVDSTLTDPRGGYRLRIPLFDSSAIYLVSVFHQGVAYFTQPIHIVNHVARPADTLRVFDTTSTGLPLRVDRRLLTIALPKPDGARDVLEIVELANPDQRTRIAADTLRPVWEGAIPPAALQFQVGAGDFSAQAAERRGDSIAVFGAVQPGSGKELSYSYVLPAGSERLSIPIDQAVGELDLLLEDTLARASAPGLRAFGVQAVEGRRFARYQAMSVPRRALVEITLSRGPFRIQSLMPLVVVLAALMLFVGFWIAVKKSPNSASTG
jgi:hypothetical protein